MHKRHGPARSRDQPGSSPSRSKDQPDSPPSLADQLYPPFIHARQLSTISTSSSEYSSISDSRDATSSDASSHATRRSSVPSEGGADRRRIAIVEMVPLSEKSHIPQPHHDPSDTLRSRRGLHTNLSGLALVAPPDASPRTYAYLSPPTAPLQSLDHTDGKRTPKPLESHPGHHRSASEIIPHRRTLSRDIGIVGTVQQTLSAKDNNSRDPDSSKQHLPQDNSTALQPPIFQQPKSASPSPSPPPDPAHSLPAVRGLNITKRDKSKEEPAALLSPNSNFTTSPHPIMTPEIGEGKDIDVPVAPPVVVGIDAGTTGTVGSIRLVTPQTSTPSSTDTTTSATQLTPAAPADQAVNYVNYQPGVHATAGPLPPPPRLPIEVSLTSPPPPRPPRLNSPLPPRSAARGKDIEAVKQALQLPPSVSAALATKTPNAPQKTPGEPLAAPTLKIGMDKTTKTTLPDHVSSPAAASSTVTSMTPSSPSFSDSSSSSYSMVQTSSVHRREGAFPPSLSESVSASHSDNGPNENKREDTVEATLHTRLTAFDEGVPHVTVISESPQPPSPILESEYERAAEHGNEHLRLNEENDEDNWVSVTRSSTPSIQHDRSTSLDASVIDQESSRTAGEAPSPPPKTFRNSLTTGLKRFSSRSLPRTPSLSSGSRRSSSVRSQRFSAGSVGGMMDINRTPSPSAYSPSLPGQPNQEQATPARQKIVKQWPSAMFCNEISTANGVGGKRRMNSSERCAIYAQKINELYMYDCGLTEWVFEMRFRGPNSNQNNNPANLNPRSPVGAPFNPQPRQISRSSMISEATFPTRPDASTATDLLSSSRNSGGGYRDITPPLPYPSLASAQRAAASNVAMTPPSSIRSLGSNSTIPSTTNTHTHTSNMNTPASTLTTLSHAPTIATSKSTGGFFATLGRKTSISSSKKPTLGLGLGGLISPISPSSSSSSGFGPGSGTLGSPSTASHRLLTKNQPHPHTRSSSRPLNLGSIPINITTPPSVVPGGPRAPPANSSNISRVQRSKTFIPPASSSFGGNGFGPRGAMGAAIERRPSLWELQVGSVSGPQRGEQIYLGNSTHEVNQTPTHLSYVHPYANVDLHGYGAADEQQPYDPYADAEFSRQVDRLASLLPNADRTILAGYLRRAGQDVLAIGQYLEDEKNGTLKAY